MLLPVYSGQKFSYSLDSDSGEYFLFENDFRAFIFLKGRDARLFRKEMERLDALPPPDSNSGLLTERLIKRFL